MNHEIKTIFARLSSRQDQRTAEAEDWIRSCELEEFVALCLKLATPTGDPTMELIKKFAQIAITDTFLRINFGETTENPWS